MCYFEVRHKNKMFALTKFCCYFEVDSFDFSVKKNRCSQLALEVVNFSSFFNKIPGEDPRDPPYFLGGYSITLGRSGTPMMGKTELHISNRMKIIHFLITRPSLRKIQSANSETPEKYPDAEKYPKTSDVWLPLFTFCLGKNA